jgi:hypothetical protein
VVIHPLSSESITSRVTASLIKGGEKGIFMQKTKM